VLRGERAVSCAKRTTNSEQYGGKRDDRVIRQPRFKRSIMRFRQMRGF